MKSKLLNYSEILGCSVEVRATVKGARAKHKTDVWVRFNRFGIEANWVVDCKFWRTPVTKEKVLALISVVDDVGADRGILVSHRGFQTGAVRAAEHTNVTLTSLEELRRTAQNDLILSARFTHAGNQGDRVETQPARPL